MVIGPDALHCEQSFGRGRFQRGLGSAATTWFGHVFDRDAARFGHVSDRNPDRRRTTNGATSSPGGGRASHRFRSLGDMGLGACGVATSPAEDQAAEVGFRTLSIEPLSREQGKEV